MMWIVCVKKNLSIRLLLILSTWANVLFPLKALIKHFAISHKQVKGFYMIENLLQFANVTTQAWNCIMCIDVRKLLFVLHIFWNSSNINVDFILISFKSCISKPISTIIKFADKEKLLLLFIVTFYIQTF